MNTRPVASNRAVRRTMRHTGIAVVGVTLGLTNVVAAASPAGPPPPDYPEITDFCSAYIVVEQSAAGEDWETTATAIGALAEHAPESLGDAVGVLTEALTTQEFETPEFAAAYAALSDGAVEECGFNTVDLVLSEYFFGGILPELPAGVTVFRAENIGEEVHELVLIRINDGVEETLEELLEMPEEESDALIGFAGIVFLFPGATGNLVADLTPGRYVAICFLPEGATPELIAQFPDGPPPPDASLPAELAALMEAAPHFVHGMVQEFTVV